MATLTQDQGASEPHPPVSQECQGSRSYGDPKLPVDETDSEDDEVLRNARNTAELLRHDNGVFDDVGREGHGYVDGGSESEGWFGRLGHRLGMMSGRDGRLSGSRWKGKYADVNSSARHRRRRRRRSREEEEEELVFELEDGDGSEDSRASSFEYVEKDGDFLRSGERLKFVSPRRCY